MKPKPYTLLPMSKPVLSVQPNDTVQTQTAKILIMDDSFTAGFLSCKVVERLGYHAKAVKDAEEFLALVPSFQPDLIFMDINLKGDQNGIELAVQCKKLFDIPIIFITAYFDSTTLEMASKANPASFVIKPVDVATYRAHIQIALQNQKEKRAVVAEINALKSQLKTVEAESQKRHIQIEELTTTNQHLISATWRERDMKKELQSTVEELTKSKTIIEKQNRKISESINYAKRIQDTIFPNEQRLRTHLPESLLYYNPKDVVSGDFPWIHRSGNSLLLAAVDCTGHGVPGALMSVVGNSLLRQIVQNKEGISPANLLDVLHVTLRRTLNRNAGRGVHDGMDVALCKIDLDTWTMEYAGAHRPLLLYRDEQVTRITGDRLAIGGHHKSFEERFSNTVIQLQPHDYIAIFTDGYPDQFGGPEDRKMGVKRIEKMLPTLANESAGEAKECVKQFYEEWQGKSKQIDDVLFIGAKVPQF